MKRMFSLKDKVHGSESPITFRWQKVHGNYLATTGHDQTVKIWNRHWQLEEEIQLTGPCTGLEWDKDGDVLCAICEKSSTLFMWDANQKKHSKIDSGAKDGLTFLLWSRTNLFLGIGTAKGNLIFYDHKVGRKFQNLGKHAKRIVSGTWSLQNLLALGGVDNTVTISDTSGKTIHQYSVRDTPMRLKFYEMKRSGGEKTDAGENVVSSIVGRKTLFIYKLFEPENKVELAFQPKYGKIETYEWYGNGYIMIGFSSGCITGISTFAAEIGQELFKVTDFRDYLSSIALSSSLNYAASCGDTSIRIHDLRAVTEVVSIIDIEDEPKGLKEIEWTSDGQLLAVSSARGSLHCYLTKLPALGDTCGTKLAFLTSLLEVTVVNQVEGEPASVVPIDVEPSFIALGPYHIAVGMNNRSWFYHLSDQDSRKTIDKEYLGTIQKMCLNTDYAAVMFEGKVQLHMIDQRMHPDVEEREARLFPERDDMGKILCCALTSEFLIYGTDHGTLHFFFIEDWSPVNKFRHTAAIKSIYPDSSGSHLAFVDEKGDGFVYNPVNDQIFPIPSLPPNCSAILWENSIYDKGVFIAHDQSTINTYIFSRESTQGPHVALAGNTHLPVNQTPLLLYNGSLTLLIASGKTTTLLLDTHSFLHLPDTGEEIQADRRCLEQAIALRRWKEAWLICAAIDSKQTWFRLGAAALHALEVDLAIRTYRHLADAGMVLALERLRDVEDTNVLAGTLASYIGEFDLAQELLLASSQPLAALDMRRDLMHWDTALKLATKLDPVQIPFIAREYGQQLEFTGEYTNALAHFEKGVVRKAEYKDHDEACVAGIARCSIRVGDIRRGAQLALQHPGRQLKKECGAILEGMRQFQEAAILFEKGEYFDKSAAVYIKSKNWQKVGELLPKITSLKIFLQYAKAKEADGKYVEAASAYHNARDYDSEVRMYLDHLRDPEKAVKVVKEYGSIEGAKMVAKFFVKHGDYGSAIQFLVLSKCNDEAFQMAQEHAQMETYADIIGDDATPEDFQSIAVHFENDKNHLFAGKFFSKCGQYSKALKHLLKSTTTDNDEALTMAIETVATSKDPKLVQHLIDFLLGEHDGAPRDANYLFKLYMALGQYNDAAQTAVIISKEEQKNGNYRHAHQLLYRMLRELRDRDIKVSAEMENNLMILHSYILVKNHVRQGNHLMAARMLIRVAENISKFPNHIVPILTTTVIECNRANLKRSGYEYAALLMRPEYRNKIDASYKKRIEHVVRKTGTNPEEDDESTSSCPYCDAELADTKLICHQCRNTLPYCVATGRHLQRENLTTCPKCKFPAIFTQFQSYLDNESTCPMCGDHVTSDELLRMRDPSKIFGDLDPSHMIDG